MLEVDAELRFLLPLGRRTGHLPVVADPTDTALHLVQAAGIPHTEVGALRLDGVPVPFTAPARARTLHVLPVARPQAAPTDPPRFLLDVHLGALARRLRILGIDTAYEREADDADLAAEAARERRVLLTQDRGLLKRRAVTAGALVAGRRVDEQLADVLDRFAPPLAPWTRCAACNGLLEAVDAAAVADALEPGTLRTYDAFARCERCGRIYWRGAHSARLEPMVERAARVVARRRGEPPPPGIVRAARRLTPSTGPVHVPGPHLQPLRAATRREATVGPVPDPSIRRSRSG